MDKTYLIKWQKRVGILCFIFAGILVITGIYFNSMGGIGIPFLIGYGIYSYWVIPDFTKGKNSEGVVE